MIGFLAVPSLLLAAPEPELTLPQVLKANTAAVNAIRSVHVTIELSNNLRVNYSDDKEEEPTGPQPTVRYEWYLDGARERVREDWLRGRRRGPHNSDASNGPDSYKRLSNYDPDFEPPLSEMITGPAVGEIDKSQTDGLLGATVRGQSQLTFGVGGTLEKDVTSRPESKLAATPATSKLGCYEIVTVQRGTPGPGRGPDVKDMRIFVDPAAGFRIRRIETGPWQKSTDPGDKGLGIMEVQEFKDCGNGIFWLLQSRFTKRLAGRTDGVEIRIRHTLHSINQPLPEQVFAIRFPDWVRVHDRDSGKVYIWGPDDKPRMTFNSEGEYREWQGPRFKDPLVEKTIVPAPRRLGWLVAVNVCGAALLALLVLWLRRRRRVAGGAS